MIDEDKVIYMTKLTVMEKNNIKKDLKVTSYFEEDYVYINNLKTRISILILMGLGIAGHLLWRVEKGLNLPTNIEEIIINYIIPYGGVVVLGLVIYTAISTFVFRRQYREADKRVKVYNQMLQEFKDKEETKIKEEKSYAYRGRTFENQAENTTAL